MRHPDPLTFFRMNTLAVTMPKVKIQPKANGEWRGEPVSEYDASRENEPKWQKENEIVEDMLKGFGPGTTVLDCPVGTGRFVALYERLGFHVQGIDANDAMLREAAAKAKGDNCFFRLGDARAIDARDGSFDVAICVRLFRWITTEEVTKVLHELQRVARKAVIFNARTQPDHPYSRPRSLIDAALLPGWRISRVDEIEPGFEMFCLEHE